MNAIKKTTATTAESIGKRIGSAIARDVIAEGMPRHWTGLDPQDVDQIPDGIDCEAVEHAAKQEYLRIIADL